MNDLGKVAILRELWDAVETEVHTVLSKTDGTVCGKARIVDTTFYVWLVHEGDDPAHGTWELSDEGGFKANWLLGN